MTSHEWKATPDGPLPLVGTVFEVPTDAEAVRVVVAGLGVYEARVNGVPVSPDLLEPAYSDYRRHVEFASHDVTRLVRAGQNTLVIHLGGGMYRTRPDGGRWCKVSTDYGDLAACAAVEVVRPGGLVSAVYSDAGWRATTGPTLSSSWTGGEDYDDALSVAESAEAVLSWPHAVPAMVPHGVRLVARVSPPVRVVEVLAPTSITSVGPDTHIVDFGVNFAGWPELTLPPEVTVRLRPGELLHPDGSLNEVTEGWGPVFHTVRSSRSALTWRPSFMYNGLRYLEITGLTRPLDAGSVRGLVLAADVEKAGRFSSSNPVLNAITRITDRAIRSNMFSVFTDCPQREKLGYLEQIHLVFDVLARSYQVEPILKRMMALIIGGQRADGSIGLYIPEWEEFPDPWKGDVNFGGAIVFLAWRLFEEYGDVQILRCCLPAAGRYLDYLLRSRVGGLVEYGLGDWDGREFRHVPLVATATLHRMLVVAARIADAGGSRDLASTWAQTAVEVREAVNRRLHRPGGGYGDDTVAENVIAINSGVVPAGEVGDLIDRCEQQVIATGYHAEVGEVAMAALVDVFACADRHETLFAMTQVADRPGYRYMLENGATSLTETWDGPTFGYSQNHFMNGAIVTWFHRDLVGIQQHPGGVGFRRILIRPRVCGDLVEVAGSYVSRAGLIESEWTVRDGVFQVTGSIPPGTSATVELPSGARHEVASGRFLFTEEFPHAAGAPVKR